MADTSGIDYVGSSLSFWMGCDPVSAGCANCFAKRDMKRRGYDPTAVVRTSDKTFRRPLARRRDGTWAWPDGERVFVCPWGDFFHAAADPWRPEAWAIIRQRPGLIFVILTKRPELIGERLPPDWSTGWPNVWLLVSAENQETANLRVPQLLSVPAAVRGVSCEPLLGAVDFERVEWPGRWPVDVLRGGRWVGGNPIGNRPHRLGDPLPRWFQNHSDLATLDWVVAGCESGPKRRRSETDWFRSLRDQCVAASVPYFLKQMDVDGKLTKMPLLDGQEWREVPK